MSLSFRALTPRDMKKLYPYFSMRPNKTCDSGGFDTFLWSEYYQVEYCIADGEALLWKMKDNGEICSAMPFCAQEKLTKYFRLLQEYFNRELGLPLLMRLADAEAVETLDLFNDPDYLVAEQEELRDYLYDAEALRHLKGKKLHKKKNQVNRFRREYEGRYEYRSLGCGDRNAILDFLAEWHQNRAGNGEESADTLEAEVCGLSRILQDCNMLEFKAGGIFIDQKLEAFSIGNENPRERMAVISIEKANAEIPGLYQVINQQFLRHEFPDVILVNREDDVGLPGLRKAKLSYQPVDFARKYLVRQKELS